jgi:hypothetical protein
MNDKSGSNFASAFDALLDKNWQRLDALGSSSPRTGAPGPRPGAVAAPPPVGRSARKIARCEGKDFSFDI